MNSLTIIGNLTRDPELRTTATGLSVCTFSVAVNRRKKQNQNQPDADYFRVTAWRELGENCAKFLRKGRKACVIGPVSVSSYTGNDGQTRFNLEVTAETVEFLSSPMDSMNASQPTQQEAPPAAPQQQQMPIDPSTGFQYAETDELPF